MKANSLPRAFGVFAGSSIRNAEASDLHSGAGGEGRSVAEEEIGCELAFFSFYLSPTWFLGSCLSFLFSAIHITPLDQHGTNGPCKALALL